MTGRGADIYSECRVVAAADRQAGGAAAHRRARSTRTPTLEADAKKYEFRPGVIEQKTALVLGDLRAKEAIPVMQAELKKPLKGDNHTGALYALGMIADPSTTKDITGVLTDAKRDFKVRISAAEALNLAGDPAALPALLQMAKTGDVVKDKEKYPDVRWRRRWPTRASAARRKRRRSRRWRRARRRPSSEFKEDAAAPRRGQEVRQGHRPATRRCSTPIRS